MNVEQGAVQIGTFIAKGLAVAVIFIVIASIFAYPIMWMWNYVVPDLFGLPELTFWKAVWGTLLCRALFTDSGAVNVKSK